MTGKNRILFTAALLFVALFFFGCADKKQTADEAGKEATTDQKDVQYGGVAEPLGEDVVRTFLSLIDQNKIPEAVAMLDDAAAPDESAKQDWSDQFTTLESIAVKSIQPYEEAQWTDSEKEYETTLTVDIKSSDASAISQYGWDEGNNLRWIVIKKDASGMWKIFSIGTGP